MQPKAETLSKSISACEENGAKLIEDAKLLRDWDRYSTALALAVLAQEEFAKAFILRLVADEALPWTLEVRTSIARHQCKHLLALVMEWLPPWDRANAVENMRIRQERHEQKIAWYDQRKAWQERRLARLKQGVLTPDPMDPEPTKPTEASTPRPERTTTE